MSDELVNVRVLLAASPSVRVQRGRDTASYVQVGPITRQADRGKCEHLSIMLARAISRIGVVGDNPPVPNLRPILGAKNGTGEA